RDATAEPDSCAAALGKDADIHTFRKIDQTLDWVSAKTMPPTCSETVSDEDLRDSRCSRKTDKRFYGIALGFQNLDRRSEVACNGEIPFEGFFVLRREVRLTHVCNEEFAAKSVRVAPAAL